MTVSTTDAVVVDMVECIMGNILSSGFYPEDVDEVAMTGVYPQFLPGEM